MRGIFWIFRIVRDLDFWICGKCSQAYSNISIFRFWNLEKSTFLRKCSIFRLYQPVLSGVVSLRGIQNQGVDFLSMESPLSEVIQLTEFPGNSLMDSSKNWKLSERSVMETHFLCLGWTPGVNFLEIRSAGSPLTEVIPWGEFPGNAATDSK